ncbi:hypothetical protein MASR1M90_04720 [Desulfovibrionales bacterium]
MKKRRRTMLTSAEAVQHALHTPEAALELAIARLWRHWPQVLGQELATLVRPLGHRKTLMVLGAANSMVMQEITFFAPQILDKANAFLGVSYFQKVQMELLSGRPVLDENLLPAPPEPRVCPRPAPLGNLLPCMDPASPVTASYQAYVRHFLSTNNVDALKKFDTD